MLGLILLLISLIAMIILIVLGYLYNLLLEEEKKENKEIKIYEDDVCLYNDSILQGKFNMALVLDDHSLLVGNDTLDEDTINNKKFNLLNNMKMEDKEVKNAENYLLKKIIKNDKF